MGYPGRVAIIDAVVILGESRLVRALPEYLPHDGRTWNLTVSAVDRKIWDSQQYA